MTAAATPGRELPEVSRDEYERLIDAIDYTLAVNGKIEADTPLHERIRKAYRVPGVTHLAAKPADEVDFSFDLRETLRAVLEFWGVDGAAKVTRHVMMARRARESNAEIDALEEIFDPLTTGEPKR